MPVRQLRPQQSQDHQTLVQRLSAEWRQPNPAATEPVILEEFDNGGGLVHVYVVWDAWQSVDRAERGEIIMEAASLRYGQEDISNVTIAMGLTQSEADRMGIAWRQ
jgi:hypothetical protein